MSIIVYEVKKITKNAFSLFPGTEGNMKHHLHGWLAGLGVSNGDVQPKPALVCLARCREGLSLAPDLCEYRKLVIQLGIILFCYYFICCSSNIQC